MVLSEADRRFFRENGYVRVREAVPRENCEAVIEAMWEFMGKDPDDPETWYRPPAGMDDYWDHQGGGMVELYHHQTLWDNRQHPRIYEAFRTILGEDRLWVSIDRVNFTPPAREEHPELDHAFIHWDVDTADLPDPLPKPYGVQGVLYLADTAEDQGGFQCVPGLYREIDDYLANRPPDSDPRHPELGDHAVVPVPGSAGDLVIWDRLLPHGNGHNRSDRPRFAQYITMSPAQEENEENRQRRIEIWRSRSAGSFPGDPRGREQRNEPAVLTPLGRRLLGLDRWDA